MSAIATRLRWAFLTLGIVLAGGAVLWGLCGRQPSLEPVLMLSRGPKVTPDYSGLVIPPNIAPLNFAINEPGASYCVHVRGRGGTPLKVFSRRPQVRIPLRGWRRLLVQNKGRELYFDIYARTVGQAWNRYLTITNNIANEAIDGYLLYRKIHPSHNTWSVMGIYQRNLETFEEKGVLENRHFGGDCCHCHSLCNNDPNLAAILIRSKEYQNSLLMINNGMPETVQGTAGFCAWHPGRRLVACSFSKPRLLLHTAKNDMRDIVDLEAWIGYFSVDANTVRRVPGLSPVDRLLAFPAWSADGRYLYYCSAPNPWPDAAKATAESYATIKYDLMRIAYDVARDQWGQPETVLAARETGFSVATPRVSPDGRWLSFCACEYGCWPTYHPESDLYMIDLSAPRAGGHYQYRRLEVNSKECESWHNWSANSRWLVFSSKRESPLFNRPYLAYVDAEGNCGKPFLLPQEDPAYYDSLLRTYTMPTLATGPVAVAQSKLVAAILNPRKRPLVMPDGKAETKPASEYP
jgi:hypothetical protein